MLQQLVFCQLLLLKIMRRAEKGFGDISWGG
jgi:hypothetical protein